MSSTGTAFAQGYGGRRQSENIKYMKQIILTIILVLGLVVAGLTYVIAQNTIKNQAIDGCLQAGKAQFKNAQGYTMTVPEEYWYKFCMKEKGMEVKK